MSMPKEIVFHHAAIECNTEQSAELFFITVLGFRKIKHTSLSKEISRAIFGIESPVSFATYDNGKSRIEVFFRESEKTTYAHLCFQVDDIKDFIARCESQGLKPFYVEKEGKQLLFVHDFSGNLYEIK